MEAQAEGRVQESAPSRGGKKQAETMKVNCGPGCDPDTISQKPKKRVKITVTCGSEGSASVPASESAASASAPPASATVPEESAAAPAPSHIMKAVQQSEWVLLHTETLTVHHCVSSRCVATGCGRYLVHKGQAMRPNKLPKNSVYSCALCFGTREPLTH